MTDGAATDGVTAQRTVDARPHRFTAVINPAAGRGRARSRLPGLVEALGASDLDVAIHLSADVDDLRAITADAFDAGRGVIACGGDGTVCAVAGIAAERDGVMGIVPIGSGNDLARHVEVPRGDVAAAIRVLERGAVTRVDLGLAEAADGTRTYFTTVANTGFDAEANRWANTLDRVSGTPLYVLAVLRTLRTYRPQRLRITIDGDVVETEAWLVAVANTRSYASGMVIAPDASIHDGKLDVCVVGPVSRPDFLRTFPGVFRGTHVQHPMVAVTRGYEVAIDAIGPADPAVPPLELWASGERVGPLPGRLAPAPDAVRLLTSP
jgi:diacylglycerol kinase (ATP)